MSTLKISWELEKKLVRLGLIKGLLRKYPESSGYYGAKLVKLVGEINGLVNPIAATKEKV